MAGRQLSRRSTKGGTPRRGAHRAKPSRREPYGWLGVGAITLGLGAAMASGSGVAHADSAGSGSSASPPSSVKHVPAQAKYAAGAKLAGGHTAALSATAVHVSPTVKPAAATAPATPVVTAVSNALVGSGVSPVVPVAPFIPISPVPLPELLGAAHRPIEDLFKKATPSVSKNLAAAASPAATSTDPLLGSWGVQGQVEFTITQTGGVYTETLTDGSVYGTLTQVSGGYAGSVGPEVYQEFKQAALSGVPQDATDVAVSVTLAAGISSDGNALNQSIAGTTTYVDAEGYPQTDTSTSFGLYTKISPTGGTGTGTGTGTGGTGTGTGTGTDNPPDYTDNPAVILTQAWTDITTKLGPALTGAITDFAQDSFLPIVFIQAGEGNLVPTLAAQEATLSADEQAYENATGLPKIIDLYKIYTDKSEIEGTSLGNKINPFFGQLGGFYGGKVPSQILKHIQQLVE